MYLSIFYFLALIPILTLHEAAHAFAALKLGDPTAERAGRVSLNPLRHLSLLGTIMLFLAGFGWGKPVPVNPRNFAHPLRDSALTALAGPMANLLIAILAAIFYEYLPDGTILWAVSNAFLELSLLLFLFNMLPFPPLDGSKFWILLLPAQYRQSVQDFFEKTMPYFVAFVVIDVYFFERAFGFSFIKMFMGCGVFSLRSALSLLAQLIV
ncbi:MAG: site-2 protease family protein [Candidatus Gracilibacteria bacterium]|jgi:Zn-dependent protease